MLYMNITIYINRQNEDLFKAETEKSKLLNELLSHHYAGFKGLPNPRKDGLPPVVVLPQAKESDVFVPRPPDPETGYPCCTKSKPCRHWAFIGEEGVWKNELTEKIRTV
jgi:hypothetical protein